MCRVAEISITISRHYCPLCERLDIKKVVQGSLCVCAVPAIIVARRKTEYGQNCIFTQILELQSKQRHSEVVIDLGV